VKTQSHAAFGQTDGFMSSTRHARKPWVGSPSRAPNHGKMTAPAANGLARHEAAEWLVKSKGASPFFWKSVICAP